MIITPTVIVLIFFYGLRQLSRQIFTSSWLGSLHRRGSVCNMTIGFWVVIVFALIFKGLP